MPTWWMQVLPKQSCMVLKIWLMQQNSCINHWHTIQLLKKSNKLAFPIYVQHLLEIVSIAIYNPNFVKIPILALPLQ